MAVRAQGSAAPPLLASHLAHRDIAAMPPNSCKPLPRSRSLSASASAALSAGHSALLPAAGVDAVGEVDADADHEVTALLAGNGMSRSSSVAVAIDGKEATSVIVPINEVDRGAARVLILMSDTGGGHRASAQALAAAFDDVFPGRTHTVIVDFWTEFAGFPFTHFPASYAKIQKYPLAWKFLYNWAKIAPTRFFTEEVFNLIAHGKVRAAIESHDPHVVVSVHPLVQNLALRVLHHSNCTVPPPYVTVVTDLGDAHPVWFHEEADACYVPTEHVRQLALDEGLKPEVVHQLGLPVRQDFWTSSLDKEALRRELGLQPEIPAVLIVSGGDGVVGLEKIAVKVADAITRTAAGQGQMVVVCGKNDKLREKLQRRIWTIHVIVTGYVSDMGNWMGACDCIVTKAGPGTIAEALIRGMPVILSSYLPGQEEGNVDFVVNNDVGVYKSNAKDIGQTVAKWFVDPELLGGMAQRARSLGRPESSRDIVRGIWKVMLREGVVQRDRIPLSERKLRYRVGSRLGRGRDFLWRYRARFLLLFLFIILAVFYISKILAPER